MPTVMALFQSLHDAEKAISELSLNGFTDKDVSLVLFSALKPTQPGRQGLLGWLGRGGFLGDTIDRSDGISRMDGTGVGAVLGSLLGIILGSQWRYGPVATSTGGLLLGGMAGYLLDVLIPEKRRDQLETNLINGLLLVQVTSKEEPRAEFARKLLQANDAKQLAVLPGPTSSIPP